ncbi:MAG: hypothetical protein JXR40_13480 [Pontiellaceae bacterium]|nr:hypothetical protein [Pontiellaceae bacterium]
MKTQLITALILAAGTAMAQQPGQTEFRGRNSSNAPVRARQRVEAETDAPQFQRPALRPDAEGVPAAPAPRGPQARQGVRGERPQLPPVEEGVPEARPGRRGPGGPQGQGRVRGERTQLPPTEGTPAARPGRRGSGGPQGPGRVRGERPQLPPADAPTFAPRRAAPDEAIDAPEAPMRARQGLRGFEGVERPEAPEMGLPEMEAPAPRAGRGGPAVPPREGMRRGGRPQQDSVYSADESEYESEADRAVRASGRRGR